MEPTAGLDACLCVIVLSNTLRQLRGSGVYVRVCVCVCACLCVSVCVCLSALATFRGSECALGGM